ncbi:sensor histidine kinase [Nonomuraea jiangxiensis]|uniref:histidine kinase n=1 Tax=Nonomuraea jiangxiensis TaxID=633440 RepID=A0A1G9F9S0_9ACTN|nr:HAMP domain-containing sensor histidine kinase [Nonomuraea jiangxiensis]SDK85105.1 two-component system, OmpR family, sensor histidine kinase PrrB [Nonomuraea jiangxiensis]
MRLSTRFALCLAVALPLLVALAGLVVVGLVSHDLREERDDQLATRLRALAPMATSYAWRTRVLPAVPPDFLQQRLATAAGSGGVCVAANGGRLLVVGEVPDTLPAGDGPGDHAEGTRRWRFVAADLGRQEGTRLILFEPEERLTEQIALLSERLVLVTLVAAAVGAVAGLALGGFAVRPLARLGRQARTIGTPAGTRLATTSGVAEIDELAGLLNDLLDRRDAAVTRTGEALETARAFASTAAHELRTPLTSMGTNLALLDHSELDPADRADVIADLTAEHGRILRLITMLRQLARGELLDPAAFAGTDLTEIVNDAAEDARRRHPHATITVRPARDVRVHGWAEGLRMIVDNLLDNAAIHGTDESGHATITVTIGTDGTGRAGAAEVVLAVEDAGPGIPAEDQDVVFDRFRRRRGSPGSGLGLTLVRQQAVLHGGTATLTASPDGPGTRAEVRLPATDRRPAEPVRSWLE